MVIFILKNKYIDMICIAVIGIAVLVTWIFINGTAFGLIEASSSPGYETRLFDDSRVHTIDLQVENWSEFLDQAPEEIYTACDVVVDGEVFVQVGLRAKGNNSLRLTEEYGLNRYSLKLEFDHFQSGGNYYGLDKFSLDSSFQDNSYMKTFLVYDMMKYMGVPTPLSSYVWVTVNGEPWGLFLAVEEPEEAFARRNYGKDYGQLYKPDYKSLKDENADVDLRYTGDEFEKYDNIFRNAKFDVSDADKERLIQSLKILDSGENLETAVNVDEVLRYFAVQVFVLNLDSYIGTTGHNYFLHEKDGVLSILPWDYNLSFGTYCLAMTNPIRNPNVLINYPIDTPWEGEEMLNRPLFHKLMQNSEYYDRYHEYMDQLLREYMENGRYEVVIRQNMQMISPYAAQDPTAFCTYEDYLLGAETLMEVCELRAEAIRGQLSGNYPITLKEQYDRKVANGESSQDGDEALHYPKDGVNAAGLDLFALGDFDDLERAKERQDEWQ